MIGRNSTDSSLASFKLRIIAAIISCIAKSLKMCENLHVRPGNCSLNCLPIVNSKLKQKSISLTNKGLLCFILLNVIFIAQKLKTAGTTSSKLSDRSLIVPEEDNIALNTKDVLLYNIHAALLKQFHTYLPLCLYHKNIFFQKFITNHEQGRQNLMGSKPDSDIGTPTENS